MNETFTISVYPGEAGGYHVPFVVIATSKRTRIRKRIATIDMVYDAAVKSFFGLVERKKKYWRDFSFHPPSDRTGDNPVARA